MSLFPRDYTVSPSPRSGHNASFSPTPSSPSSQVTSSSAYPSAFSSPSFNRDPRPEEETAMASYERRESPGFNIPRKDSATGRRASLAGMTSTSPTQSFMRRGSPLGPYAGKLISTNTTSSRRNSSVDSAGGLGGRASPIPSIEVSLNANDYNEPSMRKAVPILVNEKRAPPSHLTTSWKKEKWSKDAYSTSPVSPFTIVPTLGYAPPPPVSPGSPLKVSMIAESFAEEPTAEGKPGAPAAKWGFTFNLPAMPQLDSYHLPHINLPTISLPSIPNMTDLSGIALPSLPVLGSPFSTPKPTDPDLGTFASNTRRSSSWDYTSYEACMSGAETHEKKGKVLMKDGTGDAAHELRRANEIYGSAMGFNMRDSEPLIRKSRIVLALAAQYESPQDGVAMLRDSALDLSQAIRERVLKENVDSFALQAETSTLLCKILLTTTSALSAEGDARTWADEIGQVARQAVNLWEDAACLFIARIDDHTGSKQRQAAIQAADALMRLADTALLAARLSPQVNQMESFHNVVEIALDQASAMVMLAKPSPCASGLANPFLTHVHLLSCKNRMARTQHNFALGIAFDEDEIRGVILDVEMLAERESRRAKSMRGTKAAGASASAFKASKQLGDTKLAYANLLRHAWRNRRTEGSKHIRSASNGSNHGAELVRRLSKPRFSAYEPVFSPDLNERSRTPSLSASSDNLAGEDSRNGSTSEFSVTPSEADAVSIARPSIPSMFDARRRSSTSPGSPRKRRSWMPKSDVASGRNARMASIALPRHAVSTVLWERKPSVIAFDGPAGPGVPFTTDLVDSAWDLLEDAMKQYKVAMALLAASNMPHADMVTVKAEVLLAISDASLFQAMLSQRSMAAKERRSPCITTAEVYATWAAREVGWASVIEGVDPHRAVEKPLKSWQTVELGKMATMTALRVMWHRENEQTETTSALQLVHEVPPEIIKTLERLGQRLEIGAGRPKDDIARRFRARTQLAEMSFGSKENGFWEGVLKLNPKEVVA